METTETLPSTTFDKKKECMIMLEKARRKFRDAPTVKYLEEVCDLLCLRMKINEIEEYLRDIHIKHERFPYMRQIEDDIKRKEQSRYAYAKLLPVAPKRQEALWVSSQAPGTPAKSEALFSLIKKGKSHGFAFRIARNSKWAKRLTDDEIWECYQSWCERKVNPKLIKAIEESRTKEIEDVF